MGLSLLRRTFVTLAVLLAVAVLSLGYALPAAAQKHSGILHAMDRENPPSLSIHEESALSTVWPMMPVYSNLVLYDWDKAVESVEHLTPELAESWAWSDSGKKLTFKLRRGVTWHDGKPFTAADVKYTFDLVRDAGKDGKDTARGVGEKRLKQSPRKLWYDNVREITTSGDFEVSFLLKRPQPSLLSMLATGLSPVYPAHIDSNELRTKPVGTGPFMLKEYVPDERILLTRNPNYFVKDHPYLDGIRYVIIRDKRARTAALISGQIDIFFPQEGTAQVRDQVKAAIPDLALNIVAQNSAYDLIFNTKKPPFDNPKTRLALSYALDRAEFLKSQHGAATASAALLSPPYGMWGLSEGELKGLPGWGGAQDKVTARKLLTEAGYTRSRPLRFAITTRNAPALQEMAVWMVSELKQVGIAARLEVIDAGIWSTMLARHDFQVGANITENAPDDPDTLFTEYDPCGQSRNPADACNKEISAEIASSSQEADPKRRFQLVHEIDRKLQLDAARPVLGHALDFVMYWPHVQNFIPHHNLYSYGRMENVWLNR